MSAQKRQRKDSNGGISEWLACYDVWNQTDMKNQDLLKENTQLKIQITLMKSELEFCRQIIAALSQPIDRVSPSVPKRSEAVQPNP